MKLLENGRAKTVLIISTCPLGMRVEALDYFIQTRSVSVAILSMP